MNNVKSTEKNVNISKYTMELWNMLDVDKLYSLEDVLKIIFRIEFLRTQGIETGEINVEELYKEVNEILYEKVEISDSFEDKEKEWIGNKTKSISKILDSIVGKENRKRIYENRCQRLFTMQNCIFIVNLFITYNIEDSKRIKKKQHERVSQEYMNFLYKGVVDLAYNEKLKLTLQDVEEIWEKEYYKSIYNFKDDCIGFLRTMHDIFDKAIELYEENMENEQEAELTILDKVRLELTKCQLSIGEINNEFQKLLVLKNNDMDMNGSDDNKNWL